MMDTDHCSISTESIRTQNLYMMKSCATGGVQAYLEDTITMTHCSQGPGLVEGAGHTPVTNRIGEQNSPCVCVPDLGKERN